MSGERLGWWMLAARLGMPPSMLMDCMTSSEFTEGLAFLVWEKEHDMEFPSVDQYYLAQIAAEQRRAIAKDPKRIKLSDFLLSFSKRTKRSTTNLSRENRLRAMKSFWANATGLKRGN